MQTAVTVHIASTHMRGYFEIIIPKLYTKNKKIEAGMGSWLCHDPGMMSVGFGIMSVALMNGMFLCMAQ